MSSCKTNSKKLTENVPSQAELNATLTNTTRTARNRYGTVRLRDEYASADEVSVAIQTSKAGDQQTTFRNRALNDCVMKKYPATFVPINFSKSSGVYSAKGFG